MFSVILMTGDKWYLLQIVFIILQTLKVFLIKQVCALSKPEVNNLPASKYKMCHRF